MNSKPETANHSLIRTLYPQDEMQRLRSSHEEKLKEVRDKADEQMKSQVPTPALPQSPLAVQTGCENMTVQTGCGSGGEAGQGERSVATLLTVLHALMTLLATLLTVLYTLTTVLYALMTH